MTCVFYEVGGKYLVSEPVINVERFLCITLVSAGVKGLPRMVFTLWSLFFSFVLADKREFFIVAPSLRAPLRHCFPIFIELDQNSACIDALQQHRQCSISMHARKHTTTIFYVPIDIARGAGKMTSRDYFDGHLLVLHHRMVRR